jgi:hypothetical protein
MRRRRPGVGLIDPAVHIPSLERSAIRNTHDAVTCSRVSNFGGSGLSVDSQNLSSHIRKCGKDGGTGVRQVQDPKCRLCCADSSTRRVHESGMVADSSPAASAAWQPPLPVLDLAGDHSPELGITAAPPCWCEKTRPTASPILPSESRVFAYRGVHLLYCSPACWGGKWEEMLHKNSLICPKPGLATQEKIILASLLPSETTCGLQLSGPRANARSKPSKVCWAHFTLEAF